MQHPVNHYDVQFSRIDRVELLCATEKLTCPSAIDAAANPINPPFRALEFRENAKSLINVLIIAFILATSPSLAASLINLIQSASLY